MELTRTLIFFVYGLAFFSMGLIMLQESRRSPFLAEGRVLRPLAVFGLVHGFHEWLEMFIDNSLGLKFTLPSGLDYVRVGVLVISFSSLMVFALLVFRVHVPRLRGDWMLWFVLLAIYTLLVVLIGIATRRSHADWILHVDAAARYLLAIPAASLAAAAFLSYAGQRQLIAHKGLPSVLRVVAIGFAIYAFTQIFVPPSDVFPADRINSIVFEQWTGMPIQVIRAAMAIMITLSLLSASHLADLERQNTFVEAQLERVKALEQVQQELINRERMRKELLQHVVIAQEDERSRIARELHDDTSQTLAVLSLGLADLKERFPNNIQAQAQIDQLQILRKELARGIYNMIYDLRPAQLDDLGLVPALRSLVEDMHKRYGLKVDFTQEGDIQRLEPLVETVLFRVAQEALSNVARHADVDQAEMHMHFTADQVQMRIEDSGIGFDPTAPYQPPRGWGLAGMQERVDSIAGELRIYSLPGQGTKIMVNISQSENDQDN